MYAGAPVGWWGVYWGGTREGCASFLFWGYWGVRTVMLWNGGTGGAFLRFCFRAVGSLEPLMCECLLCLFALTLMVISDIKVVY